MLTGCDEGQGGRVSKVAILRPFCMVPPTADKTAETSQLSLGKRE